MNFECILNIIKLYEKIFEIIKGNNLYKIE